MTKPVKSNSPTEAHSYAQQGETFRLMADIDTVGQALDAFNEAVKQSPDYVWAIAHRGATYRQAGNWNAALQDFSSAIEKSNGYAWAYAQRGETYREMVIRQIPGASPQQAQADFEKAIKLDPNYAWAYAHLGATHFYLQQWETARDNFTKAIDKNNSYAWAYAFRGVVYWKGLKDFEKALPDILTALLLDPNIFSNSAFQLGMLCYLSGNDDEAIKYYKQGLKKEPDNSLVLYGLALAKARKSQKNQKGLEEAQSDIAKARAALEKTCSVALYQLAGLATLEGNTEEASKYFKEAKSLQNKSIAEPKLSLGSELASLAYNDLIWTGLADNEEFKTLMSQP